jgi:DNA-binding CsgD family transcriptional regulator
MNRRTEVLHEQWVQEGSPGLGDLPDWAQAAHHVLLARRAAPDGLSPRKAQVLGLVRAGKNRQQIADSTGLSPNTVKSHIDSLCVRFKVRNMRELREVVE